MFLVKKNLEERKKLKKNVKRKFFNTFAT